MQKLHSKATIVMAMLALLVLGVAVLPGANRPAAAQGTNLLRNPAFEEGVYTFDPDDYTWLALYPSQREDCKNNQGVYLPCGTANAPIGWIPWWISQAATDPDWKNRMPEYKPARPPFVNRIRSGVEAAQYFSFQGTHTAGLLQVVNVPANSPVRFSIWGQAWSTIDDSEFSNQPTTVNMRVGIDPTGGTNPYSPTIVWSDYQQPYDVYSQFAVETTAQGDKVTVFTISSPDEQRKHNDIYWDDAELIVTDGSGAPPPPPPATGGDTGGDTGGTTGGVAQVPPPSAGAPTATPNADGIIYAQVGSGDSFWSIAARHGLTIDQIYQLNNADAGTVLNVGDLVIVATGVAPAPAEPAAGEAAPETAPTAEAQPTAAPPQPTPEPTAQTGGAICLKAFNDENQNGLMDAGETLRAAVAFTISTSESVVSNYVTDGFSEPYCIRALPAGSYQITRSVAANERLTTTGDWSASVTDGSETIFEFGSYTDSAAPVSNSLAAAVEAPEQGEAAAEQPAAEPAASDAEQAAAPEDTGDGNLMGVLLAFAGVVVVLLLLVGVAVLVFSSRRATV